PEDGTIEETVEVETIDTEESREGDGVDEMDVEDGMELVEVVEHVDEFVGTDEKFYGPLEEGDLVTLPEKIADFLVEEGKVERSDV
ncbi:MAG: hypothetical protein ABEJ72_06340, partial [Candidatus Aenigmatarchaeota archaeon]